MNSEKEHLRRNRIKWDKWADSLERKRRRQDYLRVAQSRVISLLDLKEDIHFLDIGCGVGWAIGEVARLANDRGVFCGIDLSPKMIERARNNFIGKGNFHFVQADAESIPLESEYFDLIICTNSFHHYLHPEKALSEMHRLLRMGGKAYILDPTADKWSIKIFDKIVRLIQPEHVKLYSSGEFHTLFENADLKYTVSEMIGGHQKVHVGQR